MASTIGFIFAFAIGAISFSAHANAAGDKECGTDEMGTCGDSSALLQSRVTVDEVDALAEEKKKGNGLTGWVTDWFWGSDAPKTTRNKDVAGDTVSHAMHAMSDGSTLTPPKLLIISSVPQKKVVWTLLPDFPTKETPTFDLITQGLTAPKALALDPKRGELYVADSGAEKIFRYTLIIDKSRKKPHLASTHARITVVENCGPVEWIHLDEEGNLFYSSARTNNINKISTAVMKKLGSGELQASSLTVVSQKVLQAEAMKRAQANKTYYEQGSHLPTDAPPVLAHIHSIYEAKLNPRVANPGGLWVEGDKLFWTNQQQGATAGTVVEGQVEPHIPANSKLLAANATGKEKPMPFPAKALSTESRGATGLAKAGQIMFFCRNETIKGTAIEVAGDAMMVSGFVIGSGITIDYVRGLGGARQLLWDKAQTMFVADDVMGAVSTFPTGRIMANVPRTVVAKVPGAFGLAMTTPSDEWFKDNAVDNIHEFWDK